MTDRRKQFRATFLAVIMVLSMVAMGFAGFAGTAVAQDVGEDVYDDDDVTPGEYEVFLLNSTDGTIAWNATVDGDEIYGPDDTSIVGGDFSAAHNSSLAIQMAAENATEENGTIVVGEGEWNVSDVEGPLNITADDDGNVTSIFSHSGYGDTVLNSTATVDTILNVSNDEAGELAIGAGDLADRAASDDPGFNFSSDDNADAGVQLYETDDEFDLTIRNSHFDNLDTHSILVSTGEDVDIDAEITFADTDTGIEVTDANNVDVTGSFEGEEEQTGLLLDGIGSNEGNLSAITVSGVETGVDLSAVDGDVTIDEDSSINASETGIDATEGSTDLTIEDTDIVNDDADTDVGIDVDVEEISFDNVQVTGANIGVETVDTDIADVEVTNSSDVGINATADDAHVNVTGVSVNDDPNGIGINATATGDSIDVEDSSVDNVVTGVQINATNDEINVTGSDIESNSEGINVTNDTQAVTISDNSIVDNEDAGLIVTEDADNDNVDATSNWWGDETGPGGIAEGDGDAVQADTEPDTILVAPWYDADDVEDANLIPNTTADIDTATVGTSQTVNFETDGFPDTTSDYRVFNVSDYVIASGSTGTGSFPASISFDEVGDYNANVDYYSEGEGDGVHLGNSTNATVQSTYNVDVSVDPAEPVFGDTVTFDITVTDADDEPVEGYEVQLINGTSDADPLSSAAVERTDASDSDGKIVYATTLNDAADWYVGNATDNVVFETVSVSADEGALSIDANATQAHSEAEIEISLEDSNENPLNITSLADDSNTDINGYLNVTGPFDASEFDDTQADVINNATAEDGEVEFVHLATNETGESNFTAVPVSADDGVTAALEVNETVDGEEVTYEGVEDVRILTNATPDYVADAQTLDIDPLDDLNVQVDTDPDEPTVNESLDVDVAVTGADNLPQGTSNEDNSTLANATVTLEGVGISEEQFNDTGEDDPFEFENLYAETGGNITVSVEAVTNTSHEDVDEEETLTYSEEIEVEGDTFENLTPTEVDVQETADVSVRVTDLDGNSLNNRNVSFVHDEANAFNVTDDGDGTEGDTITIDADGEILVGGTVVDEFSSIDGGVYSVDDVTFQETGDVALEVERKTGDQDLRVNVTDAITVSGIEAYEIESDLEEEGALVGSEEQHNLTVTDIRDDERVTGEDLSDLADELEITQAGEDLTIVEAAEAVDLLDEYEDEYDTIQVTFNANESATEAVNFSTEVDDLSGAGSVDVVEPDVSTTLGDDLLTLGLNTTDVEITVEDPRTGEPLQDGSLQMTAANTTFNVTGDRDADIPDEGDAVVALDEEGGNATVSIAPNESYVDEDDISLTLGANTDGDAYFGDEVIDVGEMEIEDLPETLDPEERHSLVLDLVDANDDGVDLARVAFSGDGMEEDERVRVTDEGTFNVNIDTTDGGTIDVDIRESDDLEIASDGGEISEFAQINVFEQVQLTLTADETEIDVNDTVEFTLEREDFDRTTSGHLTVYDADDEKVDDFAIDETAEYTFEEAGEFTVEAEKPERPQVGKAFLNDSVTISVDEEEVVDDPDFQVEIDEAPGIVEQGDDYEVVVTVTNEGGEDGVQNVTYELVNATDDEVEIEQIEEDVELDAGNSTELTFEIDGEDTEDLLGDFTHTVSTDDDEATQDVEFVEDAPDIADYADDEGVVGAGGLGDAAADFRAGNIDAGLLGDVAAAFRSGESVL